MTTVETGVAGGVSFALTDEQKELRALARAFAEKEIRPRAAECDEHQTHATDIIAKAHEIGLMNLHLPEWLGGPELPCFDGMLVGEELNWGCSGIGTSIGANGLAAGPILIAGTEEQKKQWLGPLVEAPILGCFGLTEPGAGSDVSGIQTTAVRQGRRVRDQRVEDVHHERGPRVVDGRASPRPTAARAHKGLTAFVVPMDTPGVTIEKHLDKMGQRATDTSAVAFQDVVVPAANRLGGRGRGLQDRDADARLHAARHRGRRGRRRPGCVRARGRVHEGARPVRHADRDEPGRQLPRRRHGDRDRGGAPAHLAGRLDDRRGLGPQGDEVLVVRQALRRRHGDEGDDRRGPGLRRLRLHEGVPGREADARREAVPDLRGHVADPAARDRQGDLPAARNVGEAPPSPLSSGERLQPLPGVLPPRRSSVPKASSGHGPLR